MSLVLIVCVTNVVWTPCNAKSALPTVDLYTQYTNFKTNDEEP